ncbi:MAG: hypothetical protein RLZZ01_1360 [Actinomycetota bacterium]|jgi:pimeloyl-ACP methyl ester carboxylesterase
MTAGDAFDLDPVIRIAAPDWFHRALGTPFDRHSIDVAGCRIHYIAWGPPSRIGLVFVHGGGAHAHWWTHIAAMFAESVRCVAIDLSGHGDSGWRADYDLETWTDEVVAVISAEQLESPLVVGHSMGGFVTIATAARHPDALDGAVIIDSPVIETDAEVTAAQHREPFATTRLIDDPVDAVRGFRTIPPQDRYLDFVIDHVARRSLTRVGEQWRWKFDPRFWRALGGSPHTSALPYLEHVGCRIALLRCEEGLVDREIGRSMYRALGRSMPVVELPTAGHHPMLDTPLILVTALRSLFADWIHSNPRRPDRAD